MQTTAKLYTDIDYESFPIAEGLDFRWTHHAFWEQESGTRRDPIPVMA